MGSGRKKTSPERQVALDGQAVLDDVRLTLVKGGAVSIAPAPKGGRRPVLLREPEALPVDAALAAVERWLAVHEPRLAIRRGEPADIEGLPRVGAGKLHPFHRALLARFGHLEIALAPAYWAHARPGEGLRVLGVAPPSSRCDLVTEAARREEALARIEANEDDAREKKRLAARRARVPILTTLEGVADAWTAKSSGAIAWELDRSIAGAYRASHGESHLDPARGPAFALVARLLELEGRMSWIDRARAIERAVNEVEPARFDARLHLRLPRDPAIVIRLVEPRARGAPRAVSIVRVLERAAQDPVIDRRIDRAAREARSAAILFDVLGGGEDAPVARVDLLEDGLSAGEIGAALAFVGSVTWPPSGGPSFDDAAVALPSPVAGVLRGVDREIRALAGRGATVEVACVGEAFPRLRWTVRMNRPLPRDDRAPNLWRPLPGETHVGHAEMLCEAVTADRVRALFGLLAP
jgi:hypothetical protein